MKMVHKSVPKATLQRYPVYLKALRKLKRNGIERIMSKELASVVNIEPTTIRRDFSFLGNLGKQGYGYDVNLLIDIFNQELGMDFDEKIILVGAGNMGRALMKSIHPAEGRPSAFRSIPWMSWKTRSRRGAASRSWRSR